MPSKEYYQALKATQALHATNKRFSGRFLVRYLDDIRALIEQHDVKTLLDVGCGRAVVWRTPLDNGEMLERDLGITSLTLYDPGVPAFAQEPVGRFDMVICTQALGSIPVADLPWMLGRLYGWAKMVVYVGERLGPVRKKIHADLAAAGAMPHEWTREQWKEMLNGTGSGDVAVYLRTSDRRTRESLMARIQ